MARNGSGTQTSPGASFPAVTGTIIDSSKFNNIVNDINSEITKSIANDGQTPITANLPMSGFKHTGAADATATGQYLVYGQSSASLVSPALTGTPTAPTATAGTNTTQIATTAFVAASFAKSGANTDITSLNAPSLGSATATTAAQFDNTTKLATTAFVQRALGGFSGSNAYATAGQTIPASQANSYINLYGTCSSITLPLTSAVPLGSVIFFTGVSLTCTINRQGTDTFFLNATNTTGTSVTVNNGDSLLLVAGVGTWIVSGSAQLGYSSAFGSSLATSGYQKLPSGLIIQWGIATSTSTGVTVTFPMAFPTACQGLALGGLNSGAVFYTTNSVTASSFLLQNWNTSAVQQNGQSSRWIAIGY